MRRIIVHAEQCAGCRQCEMVCSFQHTERFSPILSRVRVYRDDRNGLDYPVMCRQCEKCPPIDNCPTGAMKKDLRGVVNVDPQLCTGCGRCQELCKFEAVNLGLGQALVCDTCQGNPQCVSRCPTGALEYVESGEFTESVQEAFNRMKKEWSLFE